MVERSRPRVDRLAAVCVVLAVLAMVGTGGVLLAARVSASILPSERAGLWLGVELRWLAPVALAFGVGAVVSAIVARRGASGEALVRRAARVAGTLGWISLFCTTMTVMLAPVLVVASGSGRKELCLSSMQSIGRALAMYVKDWGRQPPAGRWSDVAREYTSEGYQCPEAEAQCGYAYNRAIAGFPTPLLARPDRTVALFESDRAWNAEGGPELLPNFPRHFHGDNIAFADGHVNWCAREKPPGGIRWDSRWPREYKESIGLWWQPVGEGER